MNSHRLTPADAVETELINKAKALGLDLASTAIAAFDKIDSFCMLTYRLPATLYHVDGLCQRCDTYLEVASMDCASPLEITSNWFDARIDEIDGQLRVICDRPDGRLVFDIEVCPNA